MAIKAQSGIDIAVIPVHVQSKFIENFSDANLYGVKIGYFKWINVDQIRSVYLQAHGNNKTYVDQTNNSNFDASLYKFCINYDFIEISNEMDSKSHFYYRYRIFLGYQSGKINYSDSQFFSKNQNISNFIGGYGLGLGYQYNIKPFIGIYVDLGVNLDFILKDLTQVNEFATAQIGIRIRLN